MDSGLILSILGCVLLGVFTGMVYPGQPRSMIASAILATGVVLIAKAF